MNYFIEVTMYGGAKRLLNTRYIISITPNRYDGTNIYILNDEFFMYEEGYAEVKKMLMGDSDEDRVSTVS